MKDKQKGCLLIPFIVIGLVFIVMGMLSACSEESQEKIIRPVKTMAIGAAQNEIMRQFPGKVVASNQADLAFQVPGIINVMNVQEGDRVEKGQLIARLDQRKYIDAVNEAKARYEHTKADFLRASQLVEKNYISRSDHDKKKSEYHVAKANYSKAQNDLKDTTIVAPFNGLISRRFAENYENVKAKEAIVNIHDYDTIDVTFNVPENVVIHAREEKNRSATVTFDSAPKNTYEAKIKKFESRADDETQTYRVVVSLPTPTIITVLPGMTATVTLKLPDYESGKEGFYEVPSTAVFADEKNQAFVWLLNQGTMTVSKIPVTITRLSTAHVRITKGVNKGDVIVTAGVHNLDEGEKVRILEKKRWEQ